MRTRCASLRRPEFDITAAFLAGTADQRITHAAFRKSGGVVLGGGSLRSWESGYTLLNRFHELGFVYILEQAAAAGLAKKRAHQSQATKKSRQKMYEEAATGNPEAVERYENYLVTRRESYHRKKQEAERTA